MESVTRSHRSSAIQAYRELLVWDFHPLVIRAVRAHVLLHLRRRESDMPLNRRRTRNPLFAKRWFSDDVILVSVGWYLRFKLSYRDLAQILSQMGVAVAPCTILRWVVRYSPCFAECWRHLEKPVGLSWRCDETYVKVSGRWVYLYRAVDERGRTVASHLSRTRDVAAAKAFFRKALRRHGQPRTITLDGFEPTHSALRRMGMRNEFNFRWDNPVRIRCCGVEV